jgi:aryl-alcohol dehydrogenase-like predicted oxidoreductase
MSAHRSPSSPQRPAASGLPPLGLGLWPAVGIGMQTPAALERVLWHGAGVGVPWVDIAQGEDADVDLAVGRWLAALPEDDRPAVVTKGGVLREGSAQGGGTACVLRPSVLEAQLDAALVALGLEQVDTFLLHHPDETGTPIEDSWSAAVHLMRAGKTSRIGLCGFDLAAVRRCEAIHHVDVCLVRIDPFTLEERLPLLGWCAAHGTEVIAWVPGDASLVFDPAYAGPLAGTSYDRGDRKIERVLALSVSAEVAALAAVRRAASDAGVGSEAVVREWLLSRPGVTGVVVGAESAAQLDRWLASVSFRLSADAARRITEIGERDSSWLRAVDLPVWR